MAQEFNNKKTNTTHTAGTHKSPLRAVKNPNNLGRSNRSSDNIADVRTPGSDDHTTPKTAAKPKHKNNVKTVIFRGLVLILTLLILTVYTTYTLVSTVATGPSETVRDQLVLMAMQASATKWVPGLFLPQETVELIVSNSKKVNTETDSLDSYINSSDSGSESETVDFWKNAIDGMIFETVSGKTFKAYVLLVKDPSRVFVGTSSDYKSNKEGMNVFNIAQKYNAVAAINGGEFSDPGGVGTGNNPIGITYSQGNLMWNDGHNNRTFIGIDKNDNLVVSEGMNKTLAEALEIRDGVCFQNGNVLITSDENSITKHYADNNTGTAQRTAIGQKADGTMILIVTDGRSASSLGATHNDMIDLMINYGAITAGMLDGGSSSMMYYENYFEKYGYDINKLDKYQKKGLINKYKAFTTPRKIPTYFIVGGNNNEN